MGYLFLAVILLFALAALVYLKLNDFARETIDVLFPAIGAILLSGYLGIKSIWLDAPKEALLSVPIAILSDRATGRVSSMAVHLPSDPIESFHDFEGIRQIDTLPLYEAFADLHLQDKVRAAGDSDSILTDLVEYAILQWLAMPQQNAGWDDLGTIYTLQGATGGGGIPATYQAVKVTPNPDEHNLLLGQLPLSILLPPGTSVMRSGEHERRIEIRTPHSYLRIAVVMRGGTAFNAASTQAAVTLRKALQLPDATPSLWMATLMATVETGQSSVRRFSKQAKSEAVWLDRVRADFENDFSWDRLRHRLQSAP